VGETAQQGPDSRGNRRPGGRFTPACREALTRINLRIHDLRREFACSLLESSADLHDVRDFLGHASITTTSRYLASSPIRLAQALAGWKARTRPTSAVFAHHSHKRRRRRTRPDTPRFRKRLN
jgi:integrase